MIDLPIIEFLVPNCDLLILFVFIWWNKILTDNLFELQLICKLVDCIEHVIPLSIEVLLSCVQQFGGLVVMLKYCLQLFRFEVKLFLYAVEFVLSVQKISLLIFELFFKLLLSLLLFLQLLLSFLKLFLLLLCNFNGLRSNHHLLLHLLESINELLLLCLGLLFGVLSLSNFFNELFLLFLLHVSLILNIDSF